MKQKPLFGKGWTLDQKIHTTPESREDECSIEELWKLGAEGGAFDREVFQKMKGMKGK